MTEASESASRAEDPLRFEFVELMFALAAGEVATEVAPLAEQRFSLLHAPAYAHALLALVVIATSWVGWKTSRAAGNRQVVTGVFEWPFAVLLLDVLLVVLYYVLARGVEKASLDGSIHPSAKNETIVIALIFFGYAIWDFLTKWVMDDRGTWESLWRRLRWSLLCLAMAAATWLILADVQGTVSVLLTDIALMMLVLGFRALKQQRRLWQIVCLSAWALILLLTGGSAYNLIDCNGVNSADLPAARPASNDPLLKVSPTAQP